MATSYKTLYLELQAEHIKLTRLATRLMTQHLDDMKDKEESLAKSADNLQSVMSKMAGELTKKVASQKKAPTQSVGTPPAK